MALRQRHPSTNSYAINLFFIFCENLLDRRQNAAILCPFAVFNGGKKSRKIFKKYLKFGLDGTIKQC